MPQFKPKDVRHAFQFCDTEESNATDYRSASSSLAQQVVASTETQLIAGQSIAPTLISFTEDMDDDLDVDGIKNDDDSEDEHAENSSQVRAPARKEKQRKIELPLSVTDELIVNLKEQGYSDKNIATRLANDNLVHYDTRTIGSRYHRIRQMLEAEDAKRVEEEISDWEESEDTALFKAKRLADRDIDDRIAKLKKDRWQIAGRHLQRLVGREKRHGAKACRERWARLMDGTASIPISIDDNPEQRRLERHIHKLDVLDRNARRELDKAVEKQQKQCQREDKRLRKVILAQKRHAQQQAKCEEEIQKATEKMKKSLQRSAALLAEQQSKARVVDALSHHQVQNDSGPTSTESVTNTLRAQMSNVDKLPAASDNDPRPEVDQEFKSSPRFHLSVKELRALLSQRGLGKSGPKATLIERLNEYDQKLSSHCIRQEIESRGASTLAASRGELLKCLVECEVADSAWGRRHAVAAAGVMTKASSEGEGEGEGWAAKATLPE